MNLLLIEPSTGRSGSEPERLCSTKRDLGGVFYDYLCEEGGRIVGVRYHLMDTVDFEAHPVFSQFLDDKRFVFRSNCFVDMVSEDRYAFALQSGALNVRVVQDFDGAKVLRCKHGLAICFELQFDEPATPCS